MTLETKITARIAFIETQWEWMYFLDDRLLGTEGQHFCITKSVEEYTCMDPTGASDEKLSDFRSHFHIYCCSHRRCTYKMYGHGIDEVPLILSTKKREFKTLSFVGFSKAEEPEITEAFSSNDWDTITNCLKNKLEDYTPPPE